MAGLAADAGPNFGWRFRCGAAPLACFRGLAESFRFLSPPGDNILTFAQAHNIKMRGHTFVWHNQVPAWVFQDANGIDMSTQPFSQANKQKEWISSLRRIYRFLPFARSTYRDAAAIIAGSSQTYTEFATYRGKMFFVPGENGIDPSLYPSGLRKSQCSDKLELIFVGGLFPVKAVDLALRGAARLLQTGGANFTIVGDGPERANLEQLTRSLGIEEVVSFCGWMDHSEVIQRLAVADVLVFPSVRDFGGGVVFEALAMGAVPVVADFGGPGDIVHGDVGFKVALTNEDDVALQIEKILGELARDPSLVNRLRQQGMRYARQCLSWDGKAQMVSGVLCWVAGHGPKPDLPSPKQSGTTKLSLQPEAVFATAAARCLPNLVRLSK